MKNQYLVAAIIVIAVLLSGYFGYITGNVVDTTSENLESNSPATGIASDRPSAPETLETNIPTDSTKAIVTKVIDGDTIDIQDGERIRLLGINTPEKGQPYYKEATERLKELILEKKVSLVRDKTDRGKYGRLLRHVFVDGENVGYILLREGYANTFFISPDFKYKEMFEEAESYAKENNLGMWSSSDFKDCIGILYFKSNAEGDDRKNLNGEYVTFSNSCEFSISMEGWTIKDEATHIYEFPKFVLTPYEKVSLYTGSGTDNFESLYWGEPWPVWNNDGDTIYMWDSECGLVLSYGYQ